MGQLFRDDKHKSISVRRGFFLLEGSSFLSSITEEPQLAILKTSSRWIGARHL